MTQKPSPESLLALCLLNKKKHHNITGFFSHLEEAHPYSSELKYWYGVCVSWYMNFFLQGLQILTICMGIFFLVAFIIVTMGMIDEKQGLFT